MLGESPARQRQLTRPLFHPLTSLARAALDSWHRNAPSPGFELAAGEGAACVIPGDQRSHPREAPGSAQPGASAGPRWLCHHSPCAGGTLQGPRDSPGPAAPGVHRGRGGGGRTPAPPGLGELGQLLPVPVPVPAGSRWPRSSSGGSGRFRAIAADVAGPWDGRKLPALFNKGRDNQDDFR